MNKLRALAQRGYLLATEKMERKELVDLIRNSLFKKIPDLQEVVSPDDVKVLLNSYNKDGESRFTIFAKIKEDGKTIGFLRFRGITINKDCFIKNYIYAVPGESLDYNEYDDSLQEKALILISFLVDCKDGKDTQIYENLKKEEPCDEEASYEYVMNALNDII